MLNNYIILHTLGEGGYGKVKLAKKIINNEEKFYAIKMFKKSILST